MLPRQSVRLCSQGLGELVFQQVGIAFVQTILPVLMIAGFGYVLGRTRPIDLGPVIVLTVSVLVPAIVFDSLARATLPRGLLARLVLHVALQLVCVGLLTILAAHVSGRRGPSLNALLLATLFPNPGSIGLPIAFFGFGEAGLAIAGGWFAPLAIAASTIGVYIAAHARSGSLVALRRLVGLPITYAVAAGVIVNAAGWSLPGPIAKASQLLAGGSVAMMLLLVGLQLTQLSPRKEAGGAMLATVIRLFATPPVAWLTGRLVGLDGIALSVSVLQASTPTAITSALWAMEFDTDPELVSAAVVMSTTMSIVSLTLLVAALKG